LVDVVGFFSELAPRPLGRGCRGLFTKEMRILFDILGYSVVGIGYGGVVNVLDNFRQYLNTTIYNICLGHMYNTSYADI
jgi:hypothetical protein